MSFADVYLQSKDEKLLDFMFYVKDRKIKGIVKEAKHLEDTPSGLDLPIYKHERLTIQHIEDNPELWFLIDKSEEFIYYSHKSSILYGLLPYDLYYYVCNF